jgi:hypothetical protein
MENYATPDIAGFSGASTYTNSQAVLSAIQKREFIATRKTFEGASLC